MIVVWPWFHKYITMSGTRAITLWPLVIMRDETGRQDHRLVRHERIHLRQQLEMLIIFFYLWYVTEFLIRLLRHRHVHTSYLALSMEREAYAHESDPDYLDNRRFYAWLSYLMMDHPQS